MRKRITLLLLLTIPTTLWAGENTSARNFSDLKLKECALVANGIQRLACYDALIPPGEAREAASSAQKKDAQQAAGQLSFDDSANPNASASRREAADNGDGVTNSLVDRYKSAEKALFSFSGSFVSYRPTYILPYTYAINPNKRPFSPRTGFSEYNEPLDNEEAKYQISFKVPLLTGWMDGRTTLWLGYTQLSFWQVYNTGGSAPFRETNYQPEIFARYDTRLDVGPGRLESVSLGLTHESNGQSEPQSRSWNRITGSLVYGYDRWLFRIHPWYRIPEKNSEDDNPDIQQYIGYADYWAVYKLDDSRTLSLKLNNNLSANDNRTSVQLGYSFPLGATLKGYVQYFNGYGESLIDYNERIHRLGIGIMLNDWL